MPEDQLVAPAHVPAELVRDVDFYDLIQADEDPQTAWRKVQLEMPPIFWTPRNGGHWVATRAKDIATIQLDFERFSHRGFTIPKPMHPDPSLIFMDPPAHTPRRKLIMPAFLPRAVNRLEEKVRTVARELVDDLTPRGKCEFIEEFAKVLPIVVFLDMVNLPLSDRDFLLPLAETVVRSPSFEDRVEANAKMAEYLSKYVDERTAAPGDDLISTVIQGQVDGAPLERNEVLATCMLLLFGGLDTVASMLGFFARFLAMNPGHRRRLIEEPAIISQAVEELIRRYAMVATARLITRDFAFEGVDLREGDLIQISNCLYGLDDAVNSDPMTVDFDREAPIRHTAFGQGPHTCPGAVLARRELRIFLETWLSRIPEFELDPKFKPKITSGSVNGVTELRLRWNALAA